MKKVIFLIKCMNMGGAERVMSAIAGYAVNSNYDTTVVLTHQSLKDANLSRLDEKVKVISLEDEIGKCKKHNLQAQLKMFSARIEGKLGRIVGFDFCDNVAIKKYHARNYDRVIWLKKFFGENKNATAVAFLYDSIFLTLLSAGKKNRVIISERGDPVQSLSSRTDMAFFRKMFPKADTMVFQSPDVADWYVKNTGINGTIIFNPINDNLPAPYNGNRKKKIVNFCRIAAEKNLILLLKSYELLAEEYPEYELYIYGDADETEKTYVENFFDAVNKSKFRDHIHISPAMTGIHDEILDYAMFVSSSDFEGMSNSMLEAMAIGLPTICTDCPAGGARAIIKDHENGILVPVNDERALYSAMKELIEHPELAEKLSSNGMELRDELSSEKIMKKWMDIINGKSQCNCSYL